MALTSTSLTDTGMGLGFTTNFQVQYEDSLPNQANVIQHANALLAIIENEYTVTTGWFNTPPGNFGTGDRQKVYLNLADTATLTGTNFPGGNNTGHGNPINLDAQNLDGSATADERVKMVFMAEWSEILMSLSGGKWNAGNSSGEALSQYCSIIRFQTGHYSYYSSGSWVDTWLNSPPRQYQWVTTTKGTDKDAVSFGCALAFIYYLNVQLGFDINSIIAAGAPTLANVYKNLTGDTFDPTSDFEQIMDAAFPPNNPDGTIRTSVIQEPNKDNPFPLPSIHALSALHYVDNTLHLQPRSIRLLINLSGQHSLRPALNTNRRATMI